MAVIEVKSPAEGRGFHGQEYRTTKIMKTERLHRMPWLAAICIASVLCCGSKATAQAISQGKIKGQSQPLSASARTNAQQQISALMADKAHWTAAQKKLDTQLIFHARQKATGLVHPAAAKLRPALTPEADGRIKVDIKGTITPELLAAIKAAGGTINSSLPAYHFLRAVLPIENLEALAARSDVDFIQPAQKARQTTWIPKGITPPGHPSTSQLPRQWLWHRRWGALRQHRQLVECAGAGDCSGQHRPANTYVRPGRPESGMVKAWPCAKSSTIWRRGRRSTFATGAASAAQMASNIVALAEAGRPIICDDESYPFESPFQDQVIARAVNTVSAMGVLYFSCARNSGNLDSNMSSTWQGDFYSGKSVAGYGVELDFAHGSEPSPVTEEEILSGGYDFEADLFWSDPLGASSNDYDLYMLDSYGDIVYSSQNVQDGTQDPYEHIDDPAQYSSGYYLVVALYSGTNRFIHLDFGRGILDWVTPGSIRGRRLRCAQFVHRGRHAGRHGLRLGRPHGPYPYAFNAYDVVEYFSSDGPRRIFFNPDGSAITPGNFELVGGRVLEKPDLTAADGVTCTPPGFAPFFGTSCATPHAAAIAAMVLSYNPSLTPGRVEMC